jgi:pimeloyl-CoA synthetase
MQENIRFNTRFYKERAIRKAILAYTHLAKFRVKGYKDYIEVKVENIDKEIKNIFANEFNNYVLGVTQKCL